MIIHGAIPPELYRFSTHFAITCQSKQACLIYFWNNNGNGMKEEAKGEGGFIGWTADMNGNTLLWVDGVELLQPMPPIYSAN
nr:hypothetical protein Iba_chr10cCG3210 [Ipomoea batatas]GME21603.1 hypothetical protein Iba_scaffold28470CG0010 [Ipomoea batatas]